MYSSLGILANSKHSGKLVGTHQKLDKVALRLLYKYTDAKRCHFPNEKEILYFEGSRGPDGIKRKSPGIDEPWHFISPKKDDGLLMSTILDHQYNLRLALMQKDQVRSAFEAAWMAHAITDGLTPAHHYPYEKIVDELMSDKDYKKLFGIKIKGIMRGDNLAEAIRNNWLYWGAGGVMTKHIAFEYGVAYTVAAVSYSKITPRISRKKFANIDLKKEFYDSLYKIYTLNMYDRFLQSGWTTQLVFETRKILIPEIVRVIALAWASSLPNQKQGEQL